MPDECTVSAWLKWANAFHLSFTGNSLRRRLLKLLLSSISLLMLLVSLLAYLNSHHEVDELFDAQLAESARVLLDEASTEVSETSGVTSDSDHPAHEYERKIAFQIRDSKGNLLLRSATTPLRVLSERPEGFSDSLIDGKKWRVFSHWNRKHTLQIQVGQLHRIRGELSGRIALSLLVPFLFVIPMLAPLIWFSIERGLKPVNWISDEVRQRAVENLKPIVVADVPDEIRPLTDSINTLLSRLEYSFENERRFTADAAHELRTPLAALKTQAQVALRANESEQKRKALEQVICGVDRATHLVQQLLTLARLDPQFAQVGNAKCDLHPVVVRVLADLAPEALAKKIELAFEEDRGALVAGDAEMIGILASNLVRNAIRYTPEGGSVEVRIREDVDAVWLHVIDNGPGIDPEERANVFERFYRTLGNRASGSGLGLSIVKRIADLHHAEVTLDSGEDGKGLWVRVRLRKYLELV
ncbi:MAG: sensor histidine kinase N-terminal domain-containing protein [Burkholderiales bacterium]|nr:sensor histidine kinase N-terminal domain-containing protein [Burkholderiales bacterium]